MSTTQAFYEVGSTGRWTGKLARDDGSPVPLADVDAATVVLVDQHSKEHVNDRGPTPQDVWSGGAGAEGFQFDTSTDPETGDPITRVGWDIEEADIALLDPTRARETHLAELVVDYHLGGPPGTPKRIQHRHALECIEPRRLLCTYEDVADWLDMPDDTMRPLILRLIEAYQRRAETYCQRGFLKSTVARPSSRVFTIDEGQDTVELDRWPLDQVVSVTEAIDGNFAEGLALVEEDDFWVNADDGTVEFRWRNYQRGVGALKVVWAGGMFDDVALVDPDLRQAMAQQVAYKFNRKGKLGLSSISQGGASVVVERLMTNWLDDVKAVLDTLKRVEL